MKVLLVSENDRTVTGLREGSFIHCDDRSAVLGGPLSARVFRRAHEPLEASPGADLRQFA
jgi:dipeptidase E